VASDADFVQFVADQIADDCAISYRKMFGEYGIYSKDKMVAMICDNQLFIKPTESGKKFIGNYIEAPPYPGAKNALLIGDEVEDAEWISELIRITERELPKPKPKTKKRARSDTKS